MGEALRRGKLMLPPLLLGGEGMFLTGRLSFSMLPIPRLLSLSRLLLFERYRDSLRLREDGLAGEEDGP